jgi:hypothetical protein
VADFLLIVVEDLVVATGPLLTLGRTDLYFVEDMEAFWSSDPRLGREMQLPILDDFELDYGLCIYVDQMIMILTNGTRIINNTVLWKYLNYGNNMNLVCH